MWQNHKGKPISGNNTHNYLILGQKRRWYFLIYLKNDSLGHKRSWIYVIEIPLMLAGSNTYVDSYKSSLFRKKHTKSVLQTLQKRTIRVGNNVHGCLWASGLTCAALYLCLFFRFSSRLSFNYAFMFAFIHIVLSSVSFIHSIGRNTLPILCDLMWFLLHAVTLNIDVPIFQVR